jgi:hypothetical protein
MTTDGKRRGHRALTPAPQTETTRRRWTLELDVTRDSRGECAAAAVAYLEAAVALAERHDVFLARALIERSEDTERKGRR